MLVAIAILAISQNLYAQTWIDVTDAYIVNPRFDNDDITTGWLGTTFSANGPKENAEHYQKEYDSYQTLTGLTPGKYRVSVSAFFRSGSASDDYNHYNSVDPSQYQKAFLYATPSKGKATTPIALLASGATATNLGGEISIVGNGLYEPNNMEAAYYWFNAGYYVNSVEVEVGSDGELTIGINQSEQVTSGSGNSYNWICLDNWKIEYYGEPVDASSVSIGTNKITMTVNEVHQFAATILPDNALYRKVIWTSSNPNVAIVDTNGKVTGLAHGTATITATTIDGTNLTSSCEITVTDNAGTANSLIINEIMQENIDMFVDPSWNYGGWVELYNPTNISENIGLYWVSDDPNNLKKAKLPLKIGSVPAKGFFTLWFDHFDTRKDVGENWLNTQVNMKLDPDGGTIYISDTEGNLIVKQDYPAAIMRTSYARKTDGGSEWGYTGNPTPTATNTTSIFAYQQLDDPVVDKNGCLFEGTLQICVNIPEGAHLMYTTNGKTPNSQSSESLDGLFNINKTTVYRFRLFKDGYLPSNVVTRSYIYKDKDYYMPVISLVTNPNNLYDNTIGIYVTGTNGKTANQDYTKRNFNMEWDRPANFEFMENKEVTFNQEVNIAINGGWSRKYEPRSFKIKADKEYGIGDLQYTFFEDKAFNKNKTLLLRNGGNDNYNKYRLKDAALQTLVRQSGFKLNLQSYRPAHVFINGKYFAMLNIREPSNKHYAYANYGIDTDEIDAFEICVDSGYVQKDGTMKAFYEWYSLSAKADDPLAYEQICDRVDIDDYINYMAFKLYLYDWDWPHNNTKGFRDRNDGKFHFVIYDLDNCVDWSNGQTNTNIFTSFADKQTYTFYSIPELYGLRKTAEIKLVTIFLNMLKNEEFKKKFIDTYCIVGGSVFGDEQEITNTVTQMAEYIKTALSWEGNDPTGTGKEQAKGIINAVTGNYRSKMSDVIKAYSTFGLTNTTAQQLKISTNIPAGSITYNGIEVPRAKFNGYVFAPVTLQTSAPAGYEFVGWKELDSTNEKVENLVANGTSWKYHTISLDDVNWFGTNYDDSSWNSSKAPFGYASGTKYMATNAATTLSKTTTFYVRKSFTLTQAPKGNQTFVFNYSVDDGCIVYVNGIEIGSYHLNSGSKFSNTTQSQNSSWYESDTPATGKISIDKSLLHNGTNVVAVEIHNCSSSSSDIWFDGSLTVTTQNDGTDDYAYVSTQEQYTIPTSGNYNVQAVYKKLSDAELLAAKATPIKINEVSAANSVSVNEFFKKADWIELYNTTDDTLNVAGMYISNNAKQTKMYQIPIDADVNTKIPANGHLVVWCDKLKSTSRIHTSFKLDAEGGTIVITDKDEKWADTLNYCAHTGTMSVGRYPDGGIKIYTMTDPTINSSNHIGSDDSLYTKEPDYIAEDVNRDGIVDTQDVLQIYEFIKNSSICNKNTPEDVNGDGHVDTQDVIKVYDYMLAGASGNTVKELNDIVDAIAALNVNKGIRMIYDNGYIIINGIKAGNTKLEVYTSTGILSKNESLNIKNGQTAVYVGNLPSGTYITRVKNADSDACSCKFIIK